MAETTTETNPSLKKPTFETHAQPAMTAFIGSFQKELNPTGTTTEPPPTTAPDPNPPAPAPDPKPADPQPAAERPWPRNAKDWDAYKKADKERLDAIAKERDEWKTKYESGEKNWKATPAIPPDYESIKKERDQFDQTLRTIAVENHPKFKAYFEGKTEEQFKLAEAIGGEKGKEIVELLKSPDSQWKDARLSDLMTTLSPLQQSRLGGVMNNLTAIQSERANEIARAKAAHDQIAQQESAKAKERQTKAEELFTQTASTLQDPKNGMPAYQPRDGDAKWNDSVKARIESARSLLFGQQEPAALIKAALDAVALPAVLEQSKALMEENSQLKTQLKELQSAQPTMDNSRTNGNQPSPVPVRQAHATPQSAITPFMTNLRKGMEGEE